MVRFLIAIAFILIAAPSHANSPTCGFVYNEDSLSGIRSGLDNAQQLVRLFSVTRRTEDVRIFCNAQRIFHERYLGYLKPAIKLAVMLRQIPAAEADRLVDAMDLGIYLERFLDYFLLYQHATTPNGISDFYGEPVSPYAAKGFGNPGQSGLLHATYWQIPYGVGVPLRYHVMLSIPGGNNIPTPKLLADQLVKQLAARISFLAADGTLLKDVRDAIKGGLQAAAQYLASANIMQYGFHIDNNWLMANSDYINIGPNPRALSVDVTSPAVLKFGSWNKKVFCVYPIVPNCKNGGGQLAVTGLARGQQATLAVGFQDAFKSIGWNQSGFTWRMVFKVADQNEKPNANIEEPLQPRLNPMQQPGQPRLVAPLPLPPVAVDPRQPSVPISPAGPQPPADNSPHIHGMPCQVFDSGEWRAGTYQANGQCAPPT